MDLMTNFYYKCSGKNNLKLKYHWFNEVYVDISKIKRRKIGTK